MERIFFEGAEKKVELVVADTAPMLRSLGDPFWHRVVAASDAQVLSTIRNDDCDAYLLSESSLFVFDHKVIMITCGRTRLIDAVDVMLEKLSRDQIEFLVFQRKNEVLPQAQASGFYDDAVRLRRMFEGTAHRLGHEDEHHLFLFHHGGPLDAAEDDRTLEILMYGLHPDAVTLFASPRPVEQLGSLIEGFEVDEHHFEPSGYSLNAIRGEEYATIHVTPQQLGSYASFETNERRAADPASLVPRVLQLFRPRAFDLIAFDHKPTQFPDLDAYERRAEVAHHLESGYHVRFASFSKPAQSVGEAYTLDLSEES